MALLHRAFFPVVWFAWGAYWAYAAFGNKQVARREPIGSRLLHLVPLALGAWLIWVDPLPSFLPEVLRRPLLPSGEATFWIGALVTVAGFGFCVMARVHLAGNWSGTVTVKEHHELVRSGPYALVRHPIYTGLLLAFAGSAIARAEWRGLLALLIVWAALWRKLRLEEHWMTQTFGDAYAAYRREVPALVPRPWRHAPVEPGTATARDRAP